MTGLRKLILLTKTRKFGSMIETDERNWEFFYNVWYMCPLCCVFNYKLESVVYSEEKQTDDDSYPTLGETRQENRSRELKIPFLLASLYLGPQQIYVLIHNEKQKIK